jgi:rhodanese-related sulfurtransferase
MAEKLGYTNVKVYHEGMPEWKKAKGLVVSEPENLMDLIKQDLSFVLIDLRDAKAAEAGHIKGAASVPADGLAVSKETFPADKAAPIILYTESGTAEDAFKTVREWGYKNASALRGGLAAWKEAGGALEAGPAATKVVYVYKPRPGEILIDEFKAIVEQRPVDKLVLDVRDEDEAMQGMIVGAVNVPTAKIKEKLAEIPKDKELIVHCVTGVRAEMAYNTLKENGLKARFLNAVIQIDKDGKYEILEK